MQLVKPPEALMGRKLWNAKQSAPRRTDVDTQYLMQTGAIYGKDWSVVRMRMANIRYTRKTKVTLFVKVEIA